jgi:hypothetical protein
VREIHPWTTVLARLIITLKLDKTFAAFPGKSDAEIDLPSEFFAKTRVRKSYDL